MKFARGMPMWLALLPLVPLAILIIYFIDNSLHLMIPTAVALQVLIFILMLFFRDPKRIIAEGVVSPADGKVTVAERRGRYHYVSIFMNVHNVHVNRFPWDGEVKRITHIPGGYVPAFDKDSDHNERVVTEFKTHNGDWKLVQIAGAVARRIVPYIEEGEELKKGERFGLIRFGSRVDLEFIMPKGYELTVKPGDRIKAGMSSIAIEKADRIRGRGFHRARE